MGLRTAESTTTSLGLFFSTSPAVLLSILEGVNMLIIEDRRRERREGRGV
jgi:hypothetical protein